MRGVPGLLLGIWLVTGSAARSDSLPAPWSDAAPKPAFADWLATRTLQASAAGLTARGLPPETPTTAAVGTWKIPVPGINPLGAQDLYDLGTNHRKSGSQKISYLAGAGEVHRTLGGEGWTLSFSTRKGDALPFLREYAHRIGAEILPSGADDAFVFRLAGPDVLWWCDVAAPGPDRVELRVLRQAFLPVDRELHLTKDMYDKDGMYRFLVDVPGQKLLLPQVHLSNRAIRLFANNDSDRRSGKTMVRYLKYLDSAEYSDYEFYDFPQDPGVYEWTVQKVGDTPPDEVRLRLFETAFDLPGYTPGGMGTLRVKGVPPGRLGATPQRFVNLTEGAKTLEGNGTRDFGAAAGTDVTFQLPAGYYTLVGALGCEFREAMAQLIPVSAGQCTTVRLPGDWAIANRALQGQDDDREVAGEITVNETRDKGETAEIALSISDPKGRDVFPTRENTILTEGGTRVEILEIRREVAPCSVVLAIDSSGSMWRDMKATLEAARSFLTSLPAGSWIRVVDFDGSLRELPGSSAAEAVKGLAGLRAGGSTRLYDATLRGLELVKGKTRPAVVVFTDGVDSREDKRGTGSTATREAVVKRILEARVPVYTIGFGKRLNAGESVTAVDGAPDIGCLTQFAAASKGQYYPAKDPEALRSVFAAIGSRLGNNFVVAYRRPTEDNLGVTPVVSLVIDNSGSMSTDPKKGAKDSGFRLEKTKRLLRDFVERLPQPVVMQLTTFQGGGAKRIDVDRVQVSTTDKLRILRAFAEMTPDDGTPIVLALTSAFENLVPVASLKRVVVFLTDSGLEVPPHERQAYANLLARLRAEGIFVLWLGMGISTPEKEKVFSEAARATDGDYVISESPGELERKLALLLERLRTPVTRKAVPIGIDIACPTAEGEVLEYRAQTTANFTPPRKAGTPREPEVLALETGEPTGPSDRHTAAAVGGTALEGWDNVVCTSAEIGRTLRNQGMELTLHRAVYLDKLKGLEGRRNGVQFVALELGLRNTTAEGIPYLIPSIFKHFYFGLDGRSRYPASKATWLVEKPLTRRGDPSIRIPPGGAVTGTLVFLVPWRQSGFVPQSLHFYDTTRGHIQMPIAGPAPTSWLELAKLPATRPASLSETFTLEVTATGLEDRLDQYEAGEFSRFRVVEATFESKVQALLDLDPAERIFLRFPTASGDLMGRLGEVTGYIPLGFGDPVMLGPGAANPIRLAFDVPAALEPFGSELYFDLAKGAAAFPVTVGPVVPAPGPANEVEGEGVAVRVNQLVHLQKPLVLAGDDGTPRSLFRGNVLLDVTFLDRPGNEGTLIPADFFALVGKGYKPAGQAAAGRVGMGGPSGKGLLNPSRTNDGLLFGLGGRFGVFEGQARRALVIFDDPGPDAADWTLQSPYNDRLRVPVTKGDFAAPELLGWRAKVPVREKTFARSLDEAVAAAVAREAARDGGLLGVPVHRLEPDDGYDAIDLPSINTHGLRAMEAVTTEMQFLELMRGLTCIPKQAGGDRITAFDASPESVVTQGFGDVGATANLAMSLLSRLGFSPRLEPLEYTEAGAKAVFDYFGVDVKRERSGPAAISYADGPGSRKTFVVPFMTDLAGLSGLVYRPRRDDRVQGAPSGHSADLSVVAVYEPGTDGSAGAAAASAGSALGGGSSSGTAELVMLRRRVRFDTLSRDPVDLAFAPVTAKGRTIYGAVLTTADEVVVGDKPLADFKSIRSVRLEIRSLDRDAYTHTVTLSPGQKLEGLLVTAGLNLPDLPRAAAGSLEAAFRRVRAATTRPEPYTVARWHNRNVLYRLIAGQTAFDREMAPTGGLLLGRIARPRALVVSSVLGAEGRLTTTVDLLQPFNEIHAGSEGLRQAYSILNGLYQSSLEARILPAGSRIGYLDLWRNAPAGTELLAIPVFKGRPALRSRLEKTGTFPPRLLAAVTENEKILLVPSLPSTVAGRERLAWLELDPRTFEILSVLDDGTHGGTAEFSMLTASLGEDTREFVKGAWLGINVAVWSVVSVSLKTSDKAILMMEGKAMALKVGAMLAEFQDNLGKAKEYWDKYNELKEQVADKMEEIDSGGGGDDEGGDEGGGGEGDEDDPGAEMKEKWAEFLEKVPKVKLFGVDVNALVKDGGFRGFSNGYQSAVDAYFHAFGGSKKHIEVSRDPPE